MERRSYQQFCGVAKALDLVGERWTLLLVRELLLGPRRFTDLVEALPGIGRNLLVARLRELAAADVVERAEQRYRLTERGWGLREPVLALTRWEIDAMKPPRAGDERRPGWYALAMWAAFRPERAAGLDEACEFRVAGEVFHLAVRGERGWAARGPAESPAAVLDTDLDTFLAIAIGAEPPARAAAAGRARIEGSAAALRRALGAFGLPAPRAA